MRRQVLPFAELNGQIYVACADASDAAALEAVERYVGQQLVIKLAERESLQRALTRIYTDAPNRSTRTNVTRTEEPDDAVALSQELLHAAIIRQASDIHIEPLKDALRVRFRVDGELEEYQRLPLSREAALISRLKVLAGMDIAEKRAPQD